MSSSISAARRALYELFANASELADFQATFGPPDSHEEQKVISLMGVEDATEEEAALGAGRKEEAYRLKVGIKVHDPAGTAEEVDSAGFDAYDAFRSVVHTPYGTPNRTLNDTVRIASVVSLLTDGAVPAQGGGWVIFLFAFVLCRERVT